MPARSRSKVARLIEERELTGVGDELEERWTRAEDRSSLRDLSDYFNTQLLRNALESEDASPLDGEVENLYRLLTDDETTSGTRQQARNRLENRGVDVETLESDFVSYQSIRTYLKQYRNAEPPEKQGGSPAQLDRKRSTIQRLTSRLVQVTEQSLTELANASLITLGEFSVIVTVRVHCSECDTQRSLVELLDTGGCACQE